MAYVQRTTMKITDAPRDPNSLPGAGQTDQTGTAKQARKAYAKSAAAPITPIAPATTTDRVDVSDAGRAMQVATAALQQTPAIRADTVAKLKARITAGTYQVSGEAIAERMLTDDLLG
jgi:flagellar biosynthesis anti-sigma factor FlgM